MRLQQLIRIVIMTPFLATSSDAFLCPSTFNQIDFGDSIAQVEQMCGKADKIVKADAPDNSPQQWDYYLPQSTFDTNTLSRETPEGTLKATFAFDAQGTLVNISVNGIGVGSTSNCGGNIAIGDKRKDVESACGKPSFVNKQGPSPSAAEDKDANKQVEMTYNSSPPVTLIFREGKLAEKK